MVQSVTRVAAVSMAVALVLTFWSAACTSATSRESTKPLEVRLVARDYSFDPPTIEVPAGRPFTLVFVNEGAVEHDVEVHELGIHLHAQPGETVARTYTVDSPGEHEMACEVPGHRELGMVGEFVVE